MRYGSLSQCLIIGLSLLSSAHVHAYESPSQIEAIKRSLYPLAALQATANKLRSSCPDLVLPDLVSNEAVESKVLEKTKITLAEFIRRGEMADLLAVMQDKNEKLLRGILNSCSLTGEAEPMEEFQYQFKAALKDFDFQLAIDARKARLKAADPESYSAPLNNGELSQAQIKQIIQQAEFIVVSRVVPLSAVPEWYRKQYFGYGYMQQKVFKILQGWKSQKPLYVGVHPVFFDNEMLADPNKRWLLYVNAENAIFYAIPEAQAKAHLTLLGESSYSVSRAGEIIRAGKKQIEKLF